MARPVSEKCWRETNAVNCEHINILLVEDNSADVWLLMNAMVDYYPELESYMPQQIEEEPIDSVVPEEPATTE